MFETNPLTEFVELPDHCLNLKYCNILAGVLRGSCEMVRVRFALKICFTPFQDTYCRLIYSFLSISQVQMEVTSWFVQDQLKGDNVTELRVKFIKRLEDAIPAGED